MKAVRFVRSGRSAEIVEVLKPEPQPGEVLTESVAPVRAILTCISLGKSWASAATLRLRMRTPLGAAVEHARGASRKGIGAVHGLSKCGHCHACQTSAKN